MRTIAWVGTKSQYVAKLDENGEIVLGEDGKPVLEIDWEHENSRDVVIESITIRELQPVYEDGRREPLPIKGSYRWGPTLRSFATEMTDEDAAILLDSEDGVNFVDVTDDPDWRKRYFKSMSQQLAGA